MTYAKALYHDARDCSSDSGHTSGFVSGYVMQTKKALVNVLGAADVCHMSQTGSEDLGLQRADPVVLVFLH